MFLAKLFYAALSSIVVIWITIHALAYFNPDFTTGFLLNRESNFSIYRFPLYVHIIASPIAFLSGLIQMMRAKKGMIHHWLGRVYMISILAFAAPSALFMSFFSIGGVASDLSFFILAMLWILYTFKAWQAARAHQYARHKRWVLGSFILTNSAISLRIFIVVFNQSNLDPIDAYILASYLAWAPFILAYEWVVFKNRSKRRIL